MLHPLLRLSIKPGAPQVDQAELLGITVGAWFKPDLPGSMDDVRARLSGNNPHFFIWKTMDGRWHSGTLLPNGDYAAHNDRGKQNAIWPDFFTRQVYGTEELFIFHVPEIVNGCNTPKDYWSADSTVGGEAHWTAPDLLDTFLSGKC
jgi:hypothetical protein